MNMQDGSTSPRSVVLTQDACLDANGIDCDRWVETVFIPLTMVGDGRSFCVESREGFIEHLKALESKAQELGVVAIRTRMISEHRPSPELAVIRSIRDRMGADDVIIGSSSITWSLIRVDLSWKINQIMFNDDVYDPSVVSQVFLGRQNKV